MRRATSLDKGSNIERGRMARSSTRIRNLVRRQLLSGCSGNSVPPGGKRLVPFAELINENRSKKLQHDVDLCAIHILGWNVAKSDHRLERFELHLDLPADRVQVQRFGS